MRFPFMSIREAAFFLQVKETEARWLFDTGRLPRVELDDGTEFRPVEKALVRALDLLPLLDGRASEAFMLWQQGHGTIPKVGRTDSPSALDSLLASRDASSHDGRSGDN
jgi:hypothetical protein